MVKNMSEWVRLAGAALMLAAGQVAPAVAAPDAASNTATAVPSPKAARSGMLLGKSSITGGTLESSVIPQTRLPAGVGSYLQLLAPSAVAARGRDVFIVDVGYAAVFRYDIVLNALTVLPNLTGRPGVRLHVMADSSLLVLDPGSRRVLHVTRDGASINTYADDANLVRPVAMTVDEKNGLVLVADGMENYIVAFHMLGRASSVIVPKVPDGDRSLSISAIAMTPDGLYVLDKLARQVLHLTADGRVIESFGEDTLRQPAGIASDRLGRLVVIDSHSASLKIFSQGELVEEVRDAGLSQGEWRDIADIYADEMGNLLVADRAAGRVDILRISGSRRR